MAGRDPWENPGQFDNDTADIAAAHAFTDDRAGFLFWTFGESSYREQLWDETEKKTRLLVDRNRKPREVIAGALLERETLACDDVIRILKEQCPDFTIGRKS